jgi:cyanophycinase
MTFSRKSSRALGAAALFALASSSMAASAAPSYTYSYLGNPVAARVTARPVSCAQGECTPSVAMIGGGYDVGEAFRWMIGRAGVTKSSGGRFVVIRASGGDAYNPYVYSKLGTIDTTTDRNYDMVGGADLGLTSVETLVIPSRAAASDPFVLAVVARASAIFIAGGDQADYYNYWQETPLNLVLQRAIQNGIPVGGTSAGTAMLGQYAFAALVDGVYSSEALQDPYNQYMTIDPLNTRANKFVRDGSFVDIDSLDKVITDTHLNTRDRLGRLFGFVARIGNGCPGGVERFGDVIGMGIDEETALLVSGKGARTRVELAANPYNPENTSARYTAQNSAYFVKYTRAPGQCRAGKPLVDNAGIQVYRLSAQPYKASPYPGAPQYSFKANASFNAGDWSSQAVQGYGDGSSLSGPFTYGTADGQVLGNSVR